MGVRKTNLIVGMRSGMGHVHSHIDIIMQLRRRSIRVINYSCMCQTVCDTVYHTLMESNICLKQVNKDLRILRVRKDPLCVFKELFALIITTNAVNYPYIAFGRSLRTI